MDNNINNVYNEKKNNNTLMIILGIFIALAVFLGGFIIYDKVLNKNNGSVNDSDEKSIDETKPTETSSTNSLPEWVNYLLKQNITKMGYSNYEDDDFKWNDVSKEQLESYLKKLTTDYSLYKMRDYDGGCDIYCGLEIQYDNKKVRIFAGSIFVENDTEIVSLLEKEKYTIDNRDSSYDTWHFAYYRNKTADGFDTLEFIDYIK